MPFSKEMAEVNFTFKFKNKIKQKYDKFSLIKSYLCHIIYII